MKVQKTYRKADEMLAHAKVIEESDMKVQKTFQGRTAKQWLDIADTGPMQAGGWQINYNGRIFMKGADGMTINNAEGLLAILELNDAQAHRLDQLLEYCDARSLEEAD